MHLADVYGHTATVVDENMLELDAKENTRAFVEKRIPGWENTMAAIASTLKSSFNISRLRDPAVLRRAVLFGTGWGLAFASAMTAMNAYANGCVCIDETMWMTALSATIGVVAIGPVTALRRA